MSGSGAKKGRSGSIASRAAEYQAIGDWIRRKRIEAGYGQRELARALGKPPSFMYRVEHGQQRIDLLLFLDLLAELDVSFPDLNDLRGSADR